MISDNYLDETAEMLHGLGYEAGFMEDLIGGEDIAIMHKEFPEGDTQDVIDFYEVVPGSVRKFPQISGYDEDAVETGTFVYFIVRSEKGITKPMNFGGQWGIYIRRPN